MSLTACQSCGVVVDPEVPTMERETVFNHDGDRKTEAVRCPVCKELIPDEDGWEDA